MNKQQINYLTQKLNTAYSSATRELSNRHSKEIDEAIKAKLTEAGFSFSGSTYSSTGLISWVWTEELKERKKSLKEQADKVNAQLYQELQKVIDEINLGSDKQAVAVLESFNNLIKELIA